MGRLAHLDVDVSLCSGRRTTRLHETGVPEESSHDETLDWLAKTKAKRFRLQQNMFETDTPKPVIDKLRVAVPPGTKVGLYKTLSEFTAVFPHSTDLEGMKHELRSVSRNGNTRRHC